MKLFFPEISDKLDAINYILEFKKYNMQVNGSGSLDKYLSEYSYEEWLEKLEMDRDFANILEDRVPALTYFSKIDNKIIGMVNCRFSWQNQGLLEEYGHIGYSIRPTEQGKGYGKNQLKLALEIYKNIGYSSVLLFCKNSNIGSQKVITSNGGILEFCKDAYQKYRIKL